MSIFPSYKEQIEEINKSKQLPIFYEYAWDFELDEPKLRNNEMIKLEKNEALEVWCYFALKTYKNRFLAYTYRYGSTLEDFIGKEYDKGLVDNKADKIIKDCLLINPYIKSIDKVDTSFEGSVLSIDIFLTTIYGEMEMTYNAT